MLVTAAFIGPGTVTSAALAGAAHGYALVWTLLFATLATIVLQDMAARVALARGTGLAAALRDAAPGRGAQLGTAALLFAALALGNAAYEGGNLAGAALGLAVLGGTDTGSALAIAALAMAAGMLVLVGSPAWLERLLIGCVALMSLAFVGAAIATRPAWPALAQGLIPSVPADGALLAMALIGTTIVPYNLFLHAARLSERGAAPASIGAVRSDTIGSIAIGGVISIAILVTAAGTGLGGASGADLAAVIAAIERDYGAGARIGLGLGLAAAGLSSALTAPLATGYVLAELIGGDPARRAAIRRGAALAVVLIGAGIALSGLNPVHMIVVAQAANGLLLPIAAGFLLWLSSRRAVMGALGNGPAMTILGGMVLIICIALGIRLILRATGL